MSCNLFSAAEKIFPVKTNSLGYKVIQGCGVIQGDGVTYETLERILDAMMAEKFSAANAAFGTEIPKNNIIF